MVHYLNLGIYTGLQPLGKAVEPRVKNLSPEQQYYFHRLVEAWQYGAGGDY
jgi:lycopene cyclase CruP